MPRYQITDSQTGRTLVVEGDTPPTEQDASQLFDSRAGQAAIAVFKAQQQRDISNIKLDPYQQIQMQGQQGAMEEGNSDFLTAIGRNPVGFVKSLPADAAQMVEGAAAGIGNLPVRAYRALAGTPQIAVIQKDAAGKDVLVQEPKPLPFQPNQPVVQFPRTVMQPEGNDLERMVEGFLTPGNIAAFPFAAAKPVQAYFLTQTAPGAIDAASRLFSPNMSGDERKAAATDLLLNGLMSYGLAKGMMHQAGQVAPAAAPADYAIPPEPPAPASPEPAQAPAEVQPPEASPAVPVESPAPAVNPGPVVVPPVDPTVATASDVANQTPNDPVAQDRRLLAAWEGMGRILDAFNAGKVDEKFVRDSLDKYESITRQPYKLPLPGDWTENLDEYLKAKQPAATESAPTDSPGPAVTPATPPESSLPAEAAAPAQPEASAEPTPPAPTNIPNVGELPAAGPAKPAIIPNPLTEEDVAQNAVVQGKPLDARFVSDNGFEGQLTEHGYVRQGDQWVPAASKPLEPLNQWGVPDSQWREMAKFTTGEQLRRWGTTRARIMEQKMVQPVLSYPAIHDYLQQYVYGKAKGVHVPDVKFEVGRWSEPVLKDLQRFIPDVKDAQVTISGRALKHADEGHHDDLMGMQHELPNAIATAGEFLHNDKRPNSAYLVHRVAGKDFLIVTELARTGSGTEIVNLFHRKAADLERLRKKSNQWLEGAKSSSSNRASDRPGLLSGAQPHAKPNADTGKVNLHPYKVGDEVMYQGKKQKITRAVSGGSFIAIGKRAVHFKDVRPIEPEVAASKVADHVEQVAAGEKAAKADPALDARTGPRAAREIKAELISRLEQAIKKAPEQGGKKITISIPGDGDFTVFNSKEDLGRVLKAAKALDTSAAGRVARIPQTSSIGSHVDRIQRDASKVYGGKRAAIRKLREQANNQDLEMDDRQRENLREAADLMEQNLPENQLAKTKEALQNRISDLRELQQMAETRLAESAPKLDALKAEIASRLAEKKGVSKLRDAQLKLERQIGEARHDMEARRRELAKLEPDLENLNGRLAAALKEAAGEPPKPKVLRYWVNGEAKARGGWYVGRVLLDANGKEVDGGVVQRNIKTKKEAGEIRDRLNEEIGYQRPGQSKGAVGSVPLLGDGGELGDGKPPGTTPPADDRSFSAFNAMPMGMPEAVRVAKALTGVYPKIRERLGRFAGVFRYRQGEGARGHIEILASQFRVISGERMKQLRQQAADYAKVAAEEGDNPADIARERYDYLLQQEVIKQPVAALKTMWHEIGHVVDWLPDHIIRGRGNILGRIASLRDFTKHVLPFDPTRPAGQKITPADKARLMKAAQEALRQEMGPILETVRKIIVEEPEWRIVGITPEDIKNILRESAGKETPELTRWFSEQSDKTKADILRKAMRGMVDERLSALGKKEQVGTRRTERIVREKVGREPTPEEIKARFAELLAKEIKARNLADLATIKNELSELIAWWRGTATVPDYFKVSAEMYADAFSVWANNPAAVVKRAPMYSELMWNYLDRKPEVKALYNEIQQQIKSGQIMGHRVSNLLAMWDGDDARSLELSRENRQTSRRDFYDNVVYHFDRRFGPIYRAAKGYAGKGRVKESVAQFLYRATEHERFLGELNRVVGRRLVKAGLDWSHDLGEYLFHQRVTHERFNLANPGGWTPKDSADRLAEMQQQLGPERWRELESAAKEWHGLYQTHVVGPVVASGMFTPELADVLTSRAHYATFAAVKGIADDGLQRIIDQRFGKTNGPQIYRQIGNLGEIKNPATATVLKGLSLISAVYRNDMKRQVVEMLRAQDPENIVPARTRWNGKFNEAVMMDNHPRVGTIAYMQNGKLHAFYVRKVVADAVNGASPAENKIFNAFVKVNGWSKALFTQLNYAFWPVNFVRDTAGFMYQMPGFPALAYAKNLPKALAAARQSVLHTKPNPIADEALRRKLVISKADPRGVYAQADNEFELKVASHGMEPAAWEKEHGKVAAIVKAWNWYRELGETIERVNKISGMLYLDEKFPNLPEWQKREIIRERSGSPNFLERGASNPAVDMAFLFYNPWKEGVRSVVKAVRENPYSFAGKAVATIAMPTILQAAAVNGWLGPNRKKEYASIPDYDLTNYLCVPLGWADEGQRKIIYLRLPLWEPARIAHGSLFQTLTDRGAGILNNAGGQLPGINPVWQVGLAWSEYALGKNPIDLDRAANVMPDTTFQAGGLPALQQMGQYTWNTMGGSILTRFKNLNLEAPPETVGEKFLALPVVNNALGRWVKVSNSGLRDQDRATIAETEKQRAQIRLAAQQIADKILTQQALSLSERMMLREPYAQQYLTRILPETAKSRASMQYKRLSSAPDLESRAAIARQIQKGN